MAPPQQKRSTLFIVAQSYHLYCGVLECVQTRGVTSPVSEFGSFRLQWESTQIRVCKSVYWAYLRWVLNHALPKGS